VSDENLTAPEPPPLLVSPLFIGSNGFVSAIDPASGRELWRTRLESGVFTSTGGADVSVLVRGELLFAGAAGHLFCLSTVSGEILWKNELPGMGHNDLSLTMEGVSVQYLQKVVHRHHHR
jgi:outer membrane protein assembly factor BamB